MSSIYVVSVEIRDDNSPTESFWLDALLWIWDASQFWEVVQEDLKLRNYSLVSFGEARNWHHERHLWPNSALVEQAVTAIAKENRPLWCENKIPVAE